MWTQRLSSLHKVSELLVCIWLEHIYRTSLREVKCYLPFHLFCFSLVFRQSQIYCRMPSMLNMSSILVRINYAMITIPRSQWLIARNAYFSLIFQVHHGSALVLSETWWVTVHGVTKSWTRLKRLSTYTWDITGFKTKEKDHEWDHALALKPSALNLTQKF